MYADLKENRTLTCGTEKEEKKNGVLSSVSGNKITFKIRKLEVSDLNKGFLETLSNLTVVDLTPQQAKIIFSKIDFNAHHIFVAENEEGEIVGTATLFVTQRFIHKGGKVGHLEDMAVRKGFERKGIGSSLVRRVIEEAKKQGCYKLILDCSEENIPFYEKLGFKCKENQMRLDI